MDILFLFALIGLGFQYLIYREEKNKIEKSKILLKNEIKDLNNSNSNLKEKIELLQNGIKQKDELYESLKQGTELTLLKISSLYSDFLLIQYDISTQFLVTKSHPAFKEAKRISEIKLETKIHIEKYRQMLYKYEYLLQVFPELNEYVDDIETLKKLEEIGNLKSFEEDFDRSQFYLSKDEYLKLSINERNQLALDRYIKGQKTNWQIGRDYELFCGYNYEKEGYNVYYSGMEEKLNDMGRDLIVKKGNTHYIVQCKYWSKHKTIHEKHITQLFGTTIEYGMDHSDLIKIIPVFITNINLSERAKNFAKKLGVELYENCHLNDFPRIKCNMNKDEFGVESKIYHLPFDQQYDRTKINKKGECYAFTVEQATSLGFRRAFKFNSF